MNTMACKPMIEEYFSQLDTKMADLPSADREDFLRELRAHVLDRLEQGATASEADCRSVLAALGAPEEIARHYRMERLLSRSAWRIFPWSILRTLFRWTLTGIQGYIVLIIAMLGYVMAASFYITGILKPFFPDHIGLYVSNQGVNLAHFPGIPPGTDVLGIYYIPVAILLGYLLTVGTTMLIRSVIRRFGRLKQRVAGIA